MTGNPWLDALIVLGIIGTAEEALRRIVGRPLIRAWRKFDKFLDAGTVDASTTGVKTMQGYRVMVKST